MSTEITISVNAVRKIILGEVRLHYQNLDDNSDFKNLSSIQQALTRHGFDKINHSLWTAETIEEINEIMKKSGFKTDAIQWIEGVK